MQRRKLLKLAVYGGAIGALRPASDVLGAIAPSVHRDAHPILDAHIHLFDPTRAGGVIWPEKSDAVLYRPALPERYLTVAASFGMVGAIAIEASPLASDNDWLLKVAGANPVMVGIVGDLIPGGPTYLRELERLHSNPLFLGFRYGNLWDRDLAVDLQKPGFLDGLKALAQTGMVFESANPDGKLIGALADLGERVPDLRMVIDHLPHAAIPVDSTEREQYWSHLRALAAHPGVFIKLSEIPVKANGKLVTDPHFYRDGLDALWKTFGEDRILFGSDWPNSDHVASYTETLAIVKDYVAPKGDAVCRKFFSKNSIAAYKWRGRTPKQLAL